jgi:hypothetical protein
LAKTDMPVLHRATLSNSKRRSEVHANSSQASITACPQA